MDHGDTESTEENIGRAHSRATPDLPPLCLGALVVILLCRARGSKKIATKTPRKKEFLLSERRVSVVNPICLAFRAGETPTPTEARSWRRWVTGRRAQARPGSAGHGASCRVVSPPACRRSPADIRPAAIDP